MIPAGITDFVSLINQHLAWYPLMQIQDAYKLIYQGAMGPEHMVATRQEFSRRMLAECEALLPEPEGRLFEPVRQDGTLCRINLRPYISYKRDIYLLVNVLLQTARQVSGDRARLIKSWGEFIRICEAEKMPAFDKTELIQFNQWVIQEDYPTVHHSDAYRQAYQPAYRLIAAQLIPGLEIEYAG